MTCGAELGYTQCKRVVRLFSAAVVRLVDSAPAVSCCCEMLVQMSKCKQAGDAKVYASAPKVRPHGCGGP